MTLNKLINGVSVPMTSQEEADFLADQQAATTAEALRQTEYTTALNQIKTIAQSAVGVQLQNLTAAQVRSLLAIVLFKAGAVNKTTLTINPLNEWVK